MSINDFINPKTSESLKDALKARAKAEGVGKDETGQEFAEITTVTARFGQRVQSYIAPLYSAVEANLDTLVGLRQTLPLITEAIKRVNESPTLPKADKQKALRALTLLQAFVQKHTQFLTRVKQSLKNVAREKITSVKQGMIDDLKNSPSMIRRAVGRSLDTRYGEKASERKKALLEAEADSRESTLPENTSDLGSKRGKGQDGKWDRMLGPGSKGLGGLGSKSGMSGGTDGVDGKTLKAILSTDKNILKEVTRLAQGQEDIADDEKREDQAAERVRESALTANKDKTKKSAVSKIKETTGLGSSGGTTVLDTVVTGIVSGTIMPVLKGLAAKFGLGKILTLPRAAASLVSIPAAVATAGAAAGAAFFLGAAKAIGAKPIAQGSVYREAQKRGLSVADTQGGSDGLEPRIQLYDKLISDGKSLEEARKTADDARIENGAVVPRAMPKPVSAPIIPQKLVRAETSTNTTAAATVVPLAAPKLAETLTTPVPPSPVRAPTPTPPTIAAPKVTRAAPARGPMSMSEEGFRLLADRESFRANAYNDKKDGTGTWTIGFGTTRINGKPVTKGMTITREEALNEFRKQVKTEYEPVVRRNLGSTAISQDQFDALVSTAYNLPSAAAAAARKLRDGGVLTPSDFTRTATQNGVPNAGLKSRRLGEYNQFAGGPKEARSLTPVALSAAAAGPRSAAPLLAATHAARGGTGTGSNVNAPVVTNIVYNTTSQPARFPIPIRPKNDNETLRAMQGISSVT